MSTYTVGRSVFLPRYVANLTRYIMWYKYNQITNYLKNYMTIKLD